MKTTYLAEMIAQGGRNGMVGTPNDSLSVKLSNDDQPDSITPEHLFAGAYAASFLDSLQRSAAGSDLPLDGVTVTVRCHLADDPTDTGRLKIDLRAHFPDLHDAVLLHLLNLAHQSCPYSRAIRDSIEVSLGIE